MRRKCWGKSEGLSTIKLSISLISSVALSQLILRLSPVLYFTSDELINQLLSCMHLQVKAYFKVDVHSLTYLARQVTDHLRTARITAFK